MGPIQGIPLEIASFTSIKNKQASPYFVPLPQQARMSPLHLSAPSLPPTPEFPPAQKDRERGEQSTQIQPYVHPICDWREWAPYLPFLFLILPPILLVWLGF